MNELRKRIKRLEDKIIPPERRHLFFWTGKETDGKIAKLSPEERSRAIIFKWTLTDNEVGPEPGPIDPEESGLSPELAKRLEAAYGQDSPQDAMGEPISRDMDRDNDNALGRK